MGKNTLKLFFFSNLFIIFCILFVSSSSAAVLRWSAVESTKKCVIAGYKIHYRTIFGQYTQTLDVGNVTFWKLDFLGLTPNRRYFLAVSAYSTANIEGPLSAPVSFVYKPIATLNSVSNGSTLTSTSVTFQWENVGAYEYYLFVGSSQWGYDIYAGSQGTNTSTIVNGLPVDGSTVYVTLWSYFDGGWTYNEYIFTAYGPVELNSVSNGSTLTSTSVIFQWEDVGAYEYYLFVGTSQWGYDIYAGSQGTNTSTIVNGLPVDGSTVYVTLWSYFDGGWTYNEYIFTAYGGYN